MVSSGSSPSSASYSTPPPIRPSSFAAGEIHDEDRVLIPLPDPGGGSPADPDDHGDRYNYALLIVLYTLQGIPMGLSASIPFLIQQKIKLMASMAASAAGANAAETLAYDAVGSAAAHASKLSYNANAIFALCSWPFSLKLLWAPIVDSVFFKKLGRRKSWLVPVQMAAGLVMVLGSDFVERQLGLGSLSAATTLSSDAAAAITTTERDLSANHERRLTVDDLAGTSMDVRGVTAFFFLLYFLMATQDIAVDGWALTMLSKKNRGRGPVCNSVGQNIGYFLSFVGFLALNDAEASENLWRPLFRLPSRPDRGLVSLGTFVRWMGYFMLVTTCIVAVFKSEVQNNKSKSNIYESPIPKAKEALLSSDRLRNGDGDDEDYELDASEIGLKETYRRLWAVCKLPSVRWLFVILLTYRLPTALSDNVKFLKAVEYGLSKSTTALLSPTVILPLGILVPIVATKIWHGHPLRQFMTAFQFRVTLVPLLDLLMLAVVKRGETQNIYEKVVFWSAVILSTAGQATVSSLQFNAQMTFFASRVDPTIGGSYMTLLNTAANLGGTWPASFVMKLVSFFTEEKQCRPIDGENEVCTGRDRDPYIALQIGSCILGLLWIFLLEKRVEYIAKLPDDAWRTHLLDDDDDNDSSNIDLESPKTDLLKRFTNKQN